MSKTFSYDIRENPDDFVQRVQRIAQQHGAKFHGNAKAGVFSKSFGLFAGQLEGEYSCDAERCRVMVHKKPGLASWHRVERALDELFGR